MIGHALHLAWAYLRFHWRSSLALIVSVALIATVPVATRMVLLEARAGLGARAAATPLLLGTRGSALDLTLAALYFTPPPGGQLTQGDADAVWDSGMATAIPLHLGFTARGQAVVGTTVDYFAFRGLTLSAGRPLAQIGEAVLGAEAAARLGLVPGDRLVTDAQNLFDLAGVYPLELSVTGILDRAASADDAAIFVDIKTAWIIAGIGHGHAASAPAEDGTPVIASPAVQQFNRITPDNIDSFHLHADPATLPVSAVIVDPHDARASALLQGRYLQADNPLHLVIPATVIDTLIATLFRIGRVLDLVVAVVGVATLIAIGLAMGLSMQLRRDEMQTLFRLGARRGIIATVLGAQIGLLLLAGLGVAATLLLPVAWFSPDIAALLIAGQD